MTQTLVQRVQEVKQEHGVGTKQALDYLRARKPYEELAVELNKELDETLTPEDVEYISNIGSLLVRDTTQDGVDLRWDFPPKVKKQFIKNYVEVSKSPYLNFEEKLIALALMYSKGGSEEENAKALSKNIYEIQRDKVETSLFSKTALYSDFVWTHPMGHMDDNLSRWSDHQYSGYVRATLDRTLNRVETERRLALGLINATTNREKNADERIKTAIKFLDQEIAHVANKFGFMEQVILGLQFDLDQDEVNELPVQDRSVFSDMLDPDTCIYYLMRTQGLPTRSKEEGELSQKARDNFLFHKNAYLIRAIHSNEGWLKKMLE
jgi:hypothetical protein